MALIRLLLVFLLLPLAACSTVAAEPPEKRIAFTFDDAPLADGPLFDGPERTRRLIEALKAGGVNQAAIFVTTGNIKDAAGEARIRAYAKAGHVLANHSHSHRWLREVTPEAYLADIDTAERHLAPLPNVRPWFRYPYLNEAPDRAKRDAVRVGLEQRRLKNGYVTVDVWDWAIVNLVADAQKNGRKIDMDKLRLMYLDVVLGAIETYDRIAVDALGRSPAHTLLLHENDLAALYADDLAMELRKRGWKIVSPDEAFADPIARETPDTLYLGRGRVSALAAVKGKDPDTLFDRHQDEKVLKQMFEERGISR
jgi:peptidoglycan/xylan/chitin deacetylase (PgdA/CDA1 family)